MTSLHTANHRRIFKGQRSTRNILLMFGGLLCFFAVVLQCVPYPDWSSRIAAFVFLTVLPGSFGLYFLHAGRLLQQARVVLDETSIELNIPNWKGGWLFRSAPVSLRWEDIYSVQHEQQALIAGGKRLDHYWIHSTQGSFLLVPDLCREAAEVTRLIAERKGWGMSISSQPAMPSRITPEQEEASLKRNAVAVVVILFSLLFGIILAVTAETAVGQMLHQGLWWLSQFFNLFFIVVTVGSIFGLWWKARRERLRLKQHRRAEKI